MKSPPRCLECRVPMVEGFIPDSTYGATLQTHWHPGPAEKATIFGLPNGVQIDRSSMLPVRSFRCPDCGRLATYAHPAPRK